VWLFNRLAGTPVRRPGLLAYALGLTLGAASPGVAQSAVADSIPVVTLPQALDLALRASPSVAQSSAAIRSARAGERAALGAYLPSLGFATAATRGDILQGASTVSSGIPAVPSASRTLGDVYTSGIATTVPIFTGGRLGADRTAAREQRTAAEAGAVATRYSTTLQTKRDYFEVLRSAELIVVAQAQVEQAKEGLRDAERRLHAGTTTRSDVLRAEVSLANAENVLATAQTEHSSDQYELGRIVGRDGPVDAVHLTDLTPTPLSISPDSLYRLVTIDAPSVRAADASYRAADAAVGSAQAQYYPSLMTTAGYGWLDQRLPGIKGTTGWQFQVGVSYPIFNGFQREAGVQRAQAQSDAARITAQDAHRAARSQTEQAVGNLRLAEQRITIAERAVAAAREDLRVQQARYRAGASTFLDQITSQANEAATETALVDARYDYQIARAQLDAIAGREL